MRVDIWSDIACPWCYLGKRRFETALAGFAHRDAVEVVWHSFELDPKAPATRPGTYVGALARKFGATEAETRARLDQMTALAAADGLTYRFDLAHHANTFDAHRLLHLARAHGVQDEVKERLFAAMFTGGETVSDPATLRAIGVAAGLPADAVAELLAGDAHADDVQADADLAVEYGIGGVPFFVLDERYGVSGAQSAADLQAALEQAWAEREPATAG